MRGSTSKLDRNAWKWPRNHNDTNNVNRAWKLQNNKSHTRNDRKWQKMAQKGLEIAKNEEGYYVKLFEMPKTVQDNRYHTRKSGTLRNAWKWQEKWNDTEWNNAEWLKTVLDDRYSTRYVRNAKKWARNAKKQQEIKKWNDTHWYEMTSEQQI